MHHNFENQGYACFSSAVEGRIMDMTADVTKQPTVALKAANVFSISLYESTDINDNPHLAVVTRYCSNGEVPKRTLLLETFVWH